MGFFSELGRGIGSLIGRGMEKVGDTLGIHKLSEWGSDLQLACEHIASENPYDKEEANIHTTARLSEILTSFSEGYLQKATLIEKDCIKKVEEYFAQLIALVENATDDRKREANLKNLKYEKNRMSKDISGTIRNSLSKRMSLDDSECLMILKMDSGTEKKQAMTSFTNKVIKEALNNLAINVRDSLDTIRQDIEDELSDMSEEQEKATQALKEHFDQMANNSRLEQSDKEKSCVIPLYIVDASEYVCKILN